MIERHSVWGTGTCAQRHGQRPGRTWGDEGERASTLGSRMTDAFPAVLAVDLNSVATGA